MLDLKAQVGSTIAATCGLENRQRKCKIEL